MPLVSRLKMLLALSFMLVGTVVVLAQDKITGLVLSWENETLRHDNSARDVFKKDGFLYVGGGVPGKVSKVKISDGSVVWSFYTNQSCQSSYPVSNGRVVVFGKYYDASIVGLDDKTGKLLWTIPTVPNMSAACFADDLVFIGSYDKHLYAIDWTKGKLRWKTLLGNRVWSTPCPYEKRVLIGCYDGFLYAVEQGAGEISWKLDCGGMIGSNPVVANHLVFFGVDDQKYGEKYSAFKVRKTFLVIDLRKKKIVSRFATTTEWSSKIVVPGDDVYFFDARTLYAYDSKRAELSWKAEVDEDLLAYPLIIKSTIIMAMNYLGDHGEHQSRILNLNRAAGKRLSTSKSGGIGINQPHYVQHGDMVVLTDWMLSAYKIRTAK